MGWLCGHSRAGAGEGGGTPPPVATDAVSGWAERGRCGFCGGGGGRRCGGDSPPRTASGEAARRWTDGEKKRIISWLHGGVPHLHRDGHHLSPNRGRRGRGRAGGQAVEGGTEGGKSAAAAVADAVTAVLSSVGLGQLISQAGRERALYVAATV